LSEKKAEATIETPADVKPETAAPTEMTETELKDVSGAGWPLAYKPTTPPTI
jgi:hypothetical protein